METLNKSKLIFMGIIVLIVVIMVGTLFFQKPQPGFTLNAKEMTQELPLLYQVAPREVAYMMDDSLMNVFVDLRSSNEYKQGHLQGAINIPAAHLLDKRYTPQFEKWKTDSVYVIFYGNDQLEANGPWLVMYQMGYTNTRVLMGGINYYNRMMAGEVYEDETYETEFPLYNYKKVIEEAAVQPEPGTEDQPKKEVVVRKKKKRAAEGGC